MIDVRPITCALLILLFLGCVPGKIRRLEIVRIGEVHLRSIDAETIRMEVALDVRNPYRSSARIKDLVFDAGVGHGLIGKGTLPESTHLPAQDTVSLEIPVVIRCVDVTAPDLDALFQPAIPYRIRGFATLEKPVRKPKIEIDAQGTVKTPSPLTVALTGDSVRSILSLRDSTIRELIKLIRSGSIELEVRNPFSFPVRMNRFEYEIGFGRDSLANGSSVEAALLQPGVNKIAVPVRPRPAGVLETLLRSALDQRVPKLNLSAVLTLQRDDRELTLHLKYR